MGVVMVIITATPVPLAVILWIVAVAILFPTIVSVLLTIVVWMVNV